MKHYIGLDVSLKETHICVVDEAGKVYARGREVTEPELLAKAIKTLAPKAELAVLETGGQSSWLQSGLQSFDVAAVIVDARRAKKVLSCHLNKTDANDAEGLSQLARTGWYREVLPKRTETRLIRCLMMARQQLVKQRRDIENQIRAFLRGFGYRVGQAGRTKFEARVRELLLEIPDLYDTIDTLLMVRRSIDQGAQDLERRIRKTAIAGATSRRLMTVPGVGPMTALAFMTAIDRPERFARSVSVGPYLGLTPRSFQSGESFHSGRISKQGDALARHMLYEAANSMLSRVRAGSAPKAWATRLVKQIGPKKARVALARKLAVILHRIWLDGSEFRATALAAT